MNYKPSLYNQLVMNDKQEAIIYNPLYNNYLKIPSNYVDEVKRILSKDEILDNQFGEIHKSLSSKKFLIKSDEDEIALVNYYRDSIIYSNDLLQITIIPTDTCNFCCRYCYQDSDNPHFMSRETVGRIKNYLQRNVSRYNGIYISWFGGEPLLCKDIVLEIMEYADKICKANHVPLYGQMTTNGYELSPELFNKLSNYHILSYMITLDGLAETHNFQRPHKTNPDSYQRILSNLKGIRDTVKKRNFKIGIRVNISPLIRPTLKDFIDMLSEEFGNDTRFGVIWEYVKDWGGDRVTENQDLVLNSINDSNFDEFSTYISQKSLTFDRGQNRTNLGTELCVACRKNGFTINYDGTICKCSMALYHEDYKSINQIGYIDSYGNPIIDESKNSKWVGPSKKSEDCYQCKQYPICMGLLCPYSSKIKNKFHCTGSLEQSISSYLINLDYQGQVKELAI